MTAVLGLCSGGLVSPIRPIKLLVLDVGFRVDLGP